MRRSTASLIWQAAWRRASATSSPEDEAAQLIDLATPTVAIADFIRQRRKTDQPGGDSRDPVIPPVRGAGWEEARQAGRLASRLDLQDLRP